jgi:hypothetical protein
MQFKLLSKRVANIEGIKLKGFKNSLEKALTNAHIQTGPRSLKRTDDVFC